MYQPDTLLDSELEYSATQLATKIIKQFLILEIKNYKFHKYYNNIYVFLGQNEFIQFSGTRAVRASRLHLANTGR